ncbi:MAG: tetratricopeptide repeat protein [Ardenticatenaceae bacterium]|nr:tetratricopeptide repeat protein [Ardenticatenaceae bacterium]
MTVFANSHHLRRAVILILISLLIVAYGLIVLSFRGSVLPTSNFGFRELTIERLQTLLATNNNNANIQAQLGLAHLQQARDSGDLSHYATAQIAFEEALQIQPQQVDALMGQGMLALVRHDFDEAISWAEQARQINPYRAEILGILVDAHVELGQYDQGRRYLQQMVDTQPGQAAFSRISYLRELHGDTYGAIEAMQQAIAAGLPTDEGTLWSQLQLGQLYFESGQWDEAEMTYRTVLSARPDHPQASLGLAKIHAARGDLQLAIGLLTDIMTQDPNPEAAILLSDLYAVGGSELLAADTIALVPGMLHQEAEAGIAIEQELAFFYAEQEIHLDQALELAQSAYEQRPTIMAADTLAWVLYKNGDYEAAWQYSQEALRLGSDYPLLYFHAGMIAHALENEQTARQLLQHAIDLNPVFSLRYAAEVRIMLEQLPK